MGTYPGRHGPGMGLNAFLTYGVVKGMSIPQETALGAVSLSGFLFLLLILLWRAVTTRAHCRGRSSPPKRIRFQTSARGI